MIVKPTDVREIVALMFPGIEFGDVVTTGEFTQSVHAVLRIDLPQTRTLASCHSAGAVVECVREKVVEQLRPLLRTLYDEHAAEVAKTEERAAIGTKLRELQAVATDYDRERAYVLRDAIEWIETGTLHRFAAEDGKK